MKLKHSFIVREVVGEYVLVPMGKSALQFSAFLTTNEVGATIMKELKEHKTRQQLTEKILEEFDIDEETATKDIDEFLSLLRKQDLIEE